MPRKPRSASPTSEQECMFSDSDGFMTSGGTSHPSFVRALACLLQEKLTGVYGACAQHHMVSSIMVPMHDERSEMRIQLIPSDNAGKYTFVPCAEEIRNFVGAPSGIPPPHSTSCFPSTDSGIHSQP